MNRSKVAFVVWSMFSIFFNFGANSKLVAKINPQLTLSSKFSPLAPLFDDSGSELRITHGKIDPDFNLMPRGFKRDVKIDSTGSYLVVEETLFEEPFNLKYTIPLDDYIRYKQKNTLSVFWNQQAKRYISGELLPRDRSAGGLKIEVPVKIRSKTFQQIFGGDRVALTVTGNISIRGGFRHEKRSEVRTALTRGSDYNFKMEQTQQFQVKGHVGEKVTVSVDQNSERAFDFENTIKLKYTGYEDEIIQSIEAGNVALSLPATRFVSFSGKNSGLFGIKTVSTLGNLHLTTITSQEKGENKKLSVTGGATDDVKKIEDYRFIENQYFFIDKYYRDQYYPLDKEGKHRYDPNFTINEIEVYKSGPNYEAQAQVIPGWAVNDTLMQKYMSGQPLTENDTTSSKIGGELYEGYFKRLEQNTHYYIDPYTGALYLNNRLTDDEVLAVAYSYGPAGNETVRGDLKYENPPLILKLIKPRNLRQDDSSWDLMRRNIYSIGRNVPKEGFEVNILYKSSAGTDQETGTKKTDGEKASYLTIFGLDTRDQQGNIGSPDNVIDEVAAIIDFSLGIIEFPFHRPFDPEPNAKHPLLLDESTPQVLLEDDKRCKFYDKLNNNEIIRESKFYIEVKSKTRSTTYQLGFNVIEGSEEVTMNGARLQSGRDYILDPMTGTLNILREGADSPSANIEITYQRNEFFQLEKKTLLGANAKYTIGENSFIGGTFLYLNQRTLDQKVRVGQGPMRNMVWDINSKFTFQPDFITRLIDALPLIRTKAESRVDFEAEIAQVLPNPNTLNNENTNDNDGVAYIDDFEGANRITPMGVMRRVWTLASCPEDSIILQGRNRATKRGRLNWYNPWEQRRIIDIWPNRDVNPNVPQNVNVLTLTFDPAQAIETDNLKSNWAGIMRPLSAGYANQTESKFIEVWLQSSTVGGKANGELGGRIHIDMGQISEDAIPNYSTNFGTYSPKLNTEDKEEAGIRNQLLDDGEDIGIDGMAGPNDWWDLNGDREWQQDLEPASNDDWSYQERSRDYDQVNGTENNANDQSGRYPDTEDINGNGSLDPRNDYFSYSFHLNPDEDERTDNYIQGGVRDGWRLYRIPLADFERKVGNPSLDMIEYIRLWVDGVDDWVTIEFAEINIVGNQWLEKGVYVPVDTMQVDSLSYAYNYHEDRTDTVIVTVINTHENDRYDPSVTGVSGVRDRITRVIAKEQSLVLRINQTLPPGAEGIVQKTMPTEMNFINYNKMKMFVHGGNEWESLRHEFPAGKVEYFVRFGSNEYNYYEYRSNVFAGWDKRNYMELELGKLSSIKENIQTIKYMYVNDKILEVREDTTWTGPDSYYVRRVVNNPSLTNVRQLTLGLKNASSEPIGPTFDNGDSTAMVEVWFNEFRLSEVKKDKGIAMRIRGELGLADLMSINAEISRKEADFHTLNERFGAGQNDIQKSFGGNVRLDKFFPTEWGFSIPVNFNYRESRGEPKYLAGSDILFKDIEDKDRREAEVNYSQSQGWGVSFKKTTRSKNFFLKNTIDNFSINYSTSANQSHNSSTKEARGETHTGGVSYSLDFGRRTYIEPFKWLGRGPIVRSLSEMKVYYAPSQISASVSGNLNKNFRETRPRNDPLGEGVETKTRQFNINRQFQTSYKLVESLNFSYNRTFNNDMEHAMRADTTLEIADILKGKFGTKTQDSQTFSAKYNPNFVKWLTSNFSYNSSFRWSNNIQQPETGRSASNNTTITGNFSFNPNQMIQSLFKIGASGRRTTRRTPRRQPETDSKKKDADKEKQKEKEKDSGPNFIVSGLDFITKKMQRLSFTYNRRENQNYLGLEDKFPDWKFWLAANADPGVGIVEGVGERSSSYSFNEDYSMQTSLQIMQNMDVSLKYRYTNDKQEGANNTGGISYNVFNGNHFPDWTFRWSGLEKLPLISKFAQRVGIDHAFNGDLKEKWQNNPDNVINKTITNNWRPLIGMNITTKKGIGLNISFNKNDSESKDERSGSSKRITEDISVRANYSKRSGFRIPIPIWPFKNKEFKNNVDISVTFSSSKSQNLISRTEGNWVEQDSNEKWEFKPSMRYSFSNRVSGGMHFSIGKTKSKRIGETSLQEFAIDVNISISGN